MSSEIERIEHYVGADHDPRKVKGVTALSVAIGTQPLEGKTAILIETSLGEVIVSLPNADMITLVEYILVTVKQCQCEMAEAATATKVGAE